MKMASLQWGRYSSQSILAGLAGLAAVIVLLGSSLFNEYQGINQHARLEAETLSRLVAEHAGATVQSVDLLLRDVQGGVRPDDMRLAPGASSPRAGALHALLESHRETVPGISQLALANENGEVIHSSLATLPRANIADLSPFQRHQADPAAGLVISPPHVSSASGKWTLALSRRIDSEDGSFAGVVYAVLDLDAFEQFFRSLNLAHVRDSVLLRDQDLSLIARLPPSEKEIGVKPSNHPVAALLEQGAKQGFYRRAGPVDGVVRLYGFRQVDGLPLVAMAGIAEDDVLAEWRQRVWKYGASVAIFSLLLTVFGLRQRRTTEALFNARQVLQQVLDHIPQSIAWKDQDGKYLGGNRAYAHEIGSADLNEIQERSALDRRTSAQTQTGRQDDVDVLKSGLAVVGREEAIQQPDGGMRWKVRSKIPLKDINGGAVSVLELCEDITQFKQAEMKAQENELHLRMALSASRQAIYEINFATEIITFSPEYASIVGNQSIVLPQPISQLFQEIHPDDRDDVERMYQSFLTEELPIFKSEFRLKTGSGGWKWLKFLGAIVNRDAQGKPTQMLGTCADITERKRAEEELRQSETKFSTLYNSTRDAVMLLDEKGFFDCNKATLALYGCATKEEFCSKHPADLSPPEQPCGTNSMALANQRIATAMEKGSLRFDWVHRRADTGENFPVEVLLSAMTLGGKPVLQAVVRDITERKQAEEQLRLLNQTLEQRVAEETRKNIEQERMLTHQARHAAMGEMIGNIAHQWRQPLNALGLVVQNIINDYQDGLLDDQSLADYKKTALCTINEMSQTIDDFRNFFKPNRQKEPFGLLESIQGTLKLIDASLKNNAIALTVDCPESLTVIGLQNEFVQIMLNLLANAKDALLEKNSTLKKIEISAHAEGELAIVCVRDNGGGIPAEIMDKIFDPYFTSKESGTGIGLYMTKVIVKQHMHGHITCRNAEGGAEFTLSLPRERNQA